MSNEKTLTDAVAEAAVLFARPNGARDEEIAALGQTKGLTKAETNYLISLVASAFARRFYDDREIDFNDAFAIVFPDQKYIERHLSKNPIFAIASRMAVNLPREQCRAVTLWSSEHAAIMRALNNGQPILAHAKLAVAMKPYFDLPATAYD